MLFYPSIIEKPLIFQEKTEVCPKKIRRRVAFAALQGKPPLHNGEWAMATLQACLAMLESSRQGKEVFL